VASREEVARLERFRQGIEEFRRRYRDALPPEELEECVKEAARHNFTLLRAYACAAERLARRERKGQVKEREREEGVKARKAEERETKREEGAARPAPGLRDLLGLLRRLEWQGHAALASLALCAAHPLLCLASLPAAAMLFAYRKNTVPMWTDGGALVWRGRRYRFHRVERVFRDVVGMGPHEFRNVLLATTHEYNGVYYREGRAWVLIAEGRPVEEARAVLRRFGVVVEPRPEGRAPVELPRERLRRYAHWALLPLAAGAVSPLALPAAALASLVIYLLTARDLGHRPRRLRAISRNASYYSVPDVESVHAVALAAQPLLRETLAVWEHDPEHVIRLERRGAWTERLAWWFQSKWRLQRLDVIQVARQRAMNLHEKGFFACGLVDGRPAAFTLGRPADAVPAFTLDLAEFAPYALLLSPAECGEGSVRLGVDDAGREVCFRPEDLQTPHAFLVGKTGSGKTTLGMLVAAQLARRGVVPVAVDPHGHWARIERWVPGVQLVDARRLAPPLQLRDPGDVDLLLDALRAAGVQVFDAHFTVLLRALDRCGAPLPLQKLPDCLLAARDLASAWAVDAIYGRVLSLARMEAARVDPGRPIVVHTAGSTEPDARMKLILWTVWLVSEAKASCPSPPCGLRWLLFIDEAHALMRDVSHIASVWRELRKFGVEAVLATQSVLDIPQPLIENSGLKAVLAVEPEAVPVIAQRLYIEQSRLQRVAYESLPEERVAVIRVEGRSPVYARLHSPDSLLAR
jgi:hypothetical protein